MQNTSSLESTKGSSTEAVSVRACCPLRGLQLPAPRPEAATLGSLTTSSQSASEPLPLAELGDIRKELGELGESDEERIVYLQKRLESLKEWIRDSFGVDDPHALPEVQSPKLRRTNNANSAETASQETAEPKPSAISSPEEPSAYAKSPTEDPANRPVIPLRIKLVDDKSKTGAAVPRAGTGSKNLSRMLSKPAEPTAEAKAKIPNQTPINVFWNYIEPFFKTIDEGDLMVLEDPSKFVDPTPFTIPPLGKHYEEKWKEQYGYVCGTRSTRRRNLVEGESGAHPPLKVTAIRERLLAMLIEENLTVPETDSIIANGGDSMAPENDTGNDSPSTVASPPPELASSKCADYVHVDERIKQELSQSGLCMFVPKIDYQEDDEICAEIRILQGKLREGVCINHYRKRKLAALVREKLAAQEFYTLLSDIDKQIEQAFAKRSKVVKKKKKSGSSVVSVSSPTPASVSSTIPLVETRDKLLSAFAELVPTQREFLASSDEPIFDRQAESQVLQYARASGSWLPVPELPLHHVRLAKKSAHPVFPNVDQRERQSSIQFERPTII